MYSQQIVARMNIFLTAIAKEDMLALSTLDSKAYQRLCHWLKSQQQNLPCHALITRVQIHSNLDIFSWALSAVHRVVFTRCRQSQDIVLLQCCLHL